MDRFPRFGYFFAFCFSSLVQRLHDHPRNHRRGRPFYRLSQKCPHHHCHLIQHRASLPICLPLRFSLVISLQPITCPLWLLFIFFLSFPWVLALPISIVIWLMSNHIILFVQELEKMAFSEKFEIFEAVLSIQLSYCLAR